MGEHHLIALKPRVKCSEEECKQFALARGLCSRHYKAHYRAGTMPIAPTRRIVGEVNQQVFLTLSHELYALIRVEMEKRKMIRCQPLLRKMLAFAAKRFEDVK